jgi:hypothetical protein
MQRINGIGQEILGLFVEDGRFTTALAIWIAIAAASRPWWQSAPRIAAIALFAGFALIFCENVLHAAWLSRCSGRHR